MPTEYRPDLIDGSSAVGAGVFAERGQSSLPELDGCRLFDDAEFCDWLAVSDSVAIQPEQFTQLGCIASIGFSFAGIFGLDQHDFLATEVLEHLDQPIVKSTDFDDRLEAAAFFSAAGGQFLKETNHFLGLGANLFTKQDVSNFITQADR
jgi:hypothetical protein